MRFEIRHNHTQTPSRSQPGYRQLHTHMHLYIFRNSAHDELMLLQNTLMWLCHHLHHSEQSCIILPTPILSLTPQFMRLCGFHLSLLHSFLRQLCTCEGRTTYAATIPSGLYSFMMSHYAKQSSNHRGATRNR